MCVCMCTRFRFDVELLFFCNIWRSEEIINFIIVLLINFKRASHRQDGSLLLKWNTSGKIQRKGNHVVVYFINMNVSLIIDPGMTTHFLERTMKGGVNCISHRRRICFFPYIRRVASNLESNFFNWVMALKTMLQDSQLLTISQRAINTILLLSIREMKYRTNRTANALDFFNPQWNITASF